METLEDTVISAGKVRLNGDLFVPRNALGLVVFAHGSGSSRFSPRNRQVAASLNDSGFATLLCDLLSPEEHSRDMVTAEYRFNIPLLARRLTDTIDWLEGHETLHVLPLGLFGASTGSAAALIAAAERPGSVKAVVSRGGRPDLASGWLEQVQAPTLLIAGSRDPQVLELNERALTKIRAPRKLVKIPGAAHLFEEPGKLEEVAHHAAGWFRLYFNKAIPAVSAISGDSPFWDQR